MFRLITTCLALAFALALAATPTAAQITDYQSLQNIRSRFPPSGFPNTQIFSLTGWQTLNVTSAAAVGSANVITPNTPSVDAAQRIENIVAATSGNRILYFPTGTYYINTPLQIGESGVYLQGDGVNATQFTIATPAASNGEVAFVGPGLGAEVDVVGLPTRGSSSVTVASTSGLSVGDIVHVYDKSIGLSVGFYHYGQMGEITGISGNTLTVSPALGLDFISDPKLKEVSVIRNVGIRGIHVFRDRAASDPAANNIEFSYVKNGVAREVESSWLERGGIVSYFSMDVVMISSFVHDAYDYGEGGQAYGFLFTNNATRSRATDNKAWNLRHHFIMQRGANHGVMSLNSAEPGFNGTNGDVQTHGFTVHNSLFEQNMGRDFEFDERSDLNSEQYQGLYNTFYRNNSTRYSGNDILLAAPFQSGNFPNQFPTVIGNATGFINQAGGINSPFIGANRIGSTVVLGDAPAGWSYPPSLYTTTKPTYFGTRPWPIFGPGLDAAQYGTFGINNNLPAYDRAKP
jgi:hypothetical protein